MINEPVENLYFNWLCSRVLRVVNITPSLTYDTLFRTLHNTEFIWLLTGDDNRAEDGKELRREFLILADIPDDVDWRTVIPCSVFEMLIAFIRRCADNSNISAQDWFWEIIENLGLKEVNDASGVAPEEIQDTLEIFLWRQYPPDGDGGMFPLQRPHRNQAELEIWYQFCDYLVDRDRLPA